MTICDTIADAHYGRRADMAMVDSVTMALYAAYPGVASAPPGAESLLPSI